MPQLEIETEPQTRYVNFLSSTQHFFEPEIAAHPNEGLEQIPTLLNNLLTTVGLSGLADELSTSGGMARFTAGFGSIAEYWLVKNFFRTHINDFDTDSTSKPYIKDIVQNAFRMGSQAADADFTIKFKESKTLGDLFDYITKSLYPGCTKKIVSEHAVDNNDYPITYFNYVIPNSDIKISGRYGTITSNVHLQSLRLWFFKGDNQLSIVDLLPDNPDRQKRFGAESSSLHAKTKYNLIFDKKNELFIEVTPEQQMAFSGKGELPINESTTLGDLAETLLRDLRIQLINGKYSFRYRDIYPLYKLNNLFEIRGKLLEMKQKGEMLPEEIKSMLLLESLIILQLNPWAYWQMTRDTGLVKFFNIDLTTPQFYNILTQIPLFISTSDTGVNPVNLPTKEKWLHINEQPDPFRQSYFDSRAEKFIKAMFEVIYPQNPPPKSPYITFGNILFGERNIITEPLSVTATEITTLINQSVTATLTQRPDGNYQITATLSIKPGSQFIDINEKRFTKNHISRYFREYFPKGKINPRYFMQIVNILQFMPSITEKELHTVFNSSATEIADHKTFRRMLLLLKSAGVIGTSERYDPTKNTKILFYELRQNIKPDYLENNYSNPYLTILITWLSKFGFLGKYSILTLSEADLKLLNEISPLPEKLSQSNPNLSQIELIKSLLKQIKSNPLTY
jgi:hypothetical protein